MVLSLRKSGRAARMMPFSASELEALCAAMLERAGRPEVGIELVLLDDADMEALHGQSLGRAGPTNILAFPAQSDSGVAPSGLARGADAGDDAAPFLGSLALSVDTLRRECFLYGQDAPEHCVRLLAHGLAHLLGHDHGPAMDVLTVRLERAVLDRGFI